ncbi:unnamed protein product [Sphagnum tenellum]
MEPNLMEKLHREFLCVPVCACSVFHEHPVEPVNHLERSDGHLRNASILVLPAVSIDAGQFAVSSHLHTRSSKSGVVWRNFIFCRALERILWVIYQRGKSRLHLKEYDDQGLSIVQQHTPDC